ncbi:CAAX amino terminal protease family [Halobacteroides halobius DSM 5150]|uniref:CAAX amino terminal protease family n=1 Tax=Halobacteroides halobius (strain ATCC 35273 / DSM 5150 / MD-1) TaxID=748449 RepID=L0K616_HALHC|nr:type II CAAX endopeptidase family protein [Halobacteroides halobius]AGB40717.1 CAAX amino terminal protease family [Halobacteroides halobius DSM 5150]
MGDNSINRQIDWQLADIILVLFFTLTVTPILFHVVWWGLDQILALDSLMQIRLLILNLIQAVLLGSLTLIVVTRNYYLSVSNFGLKKIDIDSILKYGVVGGIVICIFVVLINNLIHAVVSKIYGINPPTQQVIKDLLKSNNNWIFILHTCLIVIIAPISEEIFFRGFIYSYCKSKLGITKGILLNGVIFGLAHFSIWVFIPTFLGGIILAWIYERTNSLYSSILAHGVWNLIIVLLIFIIWKAGIF